MKFIVFVGTEGAMPEEALKTMNEAWPAYEQELSRRRLWHLGRELDLPENGVVTVRNRDGKTLVTDGPFAETKEFIAGFSLHECADLDELIEIQRLNPVVRFNPFELRAFSDEPVLTPRTERFAAFDDVAGRPYLLSTWVDREQGSAVPSSPDQAAGYAIWQQGSGAYVLGGRLAPPESAIVTHFVDGELRVSKGSFLHTDAFIAGIDVIISADLQAAATIAATHPLALHHAIEVRPFYSEGGAA